MMKRRDFYFNLPDELIAQYPLSKRSDSRLLVYEKNISESFAHKQFRNLVDYLKPHDLLVFNNSKVIPARIFGHKISGGKVEILIERILDSYEFRAHIKASKALKSGAVIVLDKGLEIQVIAKTEDLYHCKATMPIMQILQEQGHIPLPPYITRKDEIIDTNRYQTVYAEHDGSVAAPTAGLHFDEYILDQIAQKGINFAYVTLHVGAGTFRPVRVDSLVDHKMHSEIITVREDVCALIKSTKVLGGRVIAVGTTTLRSLETAALDGELRPYCGETDIFIYPGFKFKVIDGLITNFHLPESTLLMLVSAFIGYQTTMDLYKCAVENKYRFFSYGDACLLIN